MARVLQLFLFLWLAIAPAVAWQYAIHTAPPHDYHSSHLEALQQELHRTREQLAEQRLLVDQLRQAPPHAPSPPMAKPAPSPSAQPRCSLCGLLPTLMLLGFLGTSSRIAGVGAPSAHLHGRCGVMRFFSHGLKAIVSGSLAAMGFSLFWHSFWLLLWALPALFLIALPAMLTSCCSASEIIQRGEVLPAAPLARGSKGPGVAQLQHCLIELGHMQPTAIRYCAGIFGVRTEQALWAVQQQMDTATQQQAGIYTAEVQEELMLQLAMAASRSIPADELSVTSDTQQPPARPADAKVASTNTSNTQGLPALVSDSGGQATKVSGKAQLISKQALSTAETSVAADSTSLLLSMGFSDHDIAEVIRANNGTLDGGAHLLLKRPVPEFLPEWQPQLNELTEMLGFGEKEARAALTQTGGELKAAIKALLAAERAGKPFVG